MVMFKKKFEICDYVIVKNKNSGYYNREGTITTMSDLYVTFIDEFGNSGVVTLKSIKHKKYEDIYL